VRLFAEAHRRRYWTPASPLEEIAADGPSFRAGSASGAEQSRQRRLSERDNIASQVEWR
jgi:hypothetical protein